MRCTLRRFVVLFALVASACLHAQQVTLAGLKSLNGAGAFVGLRQDAAGNLYTLFAAGDGVRLLKFNSTGTALLGQAQIGQLGDTGIALDLDAAGNVYVAGTSDSRGSVTGTTGTAFSNRAGTRTNSFVAKFAPSLTLQWLTFCGAEPMSVAGISVTSTSILITGSIFQVGDPNNALPVTPSGIQQSPAPASTSDGFVESFVTGTGTLQYATYLTGANGATSPAAIVADSSGNAYIAGTTTATGFPTTAALVPVFRSTGGNATGFVTKLDAAGDSFLFSTFVPGNGLTGAALDANGTGALLLSGDVAAGLFPLTQVQAPVAPLLRYQTALRMTLDGSLVISSTLLAPGTESVIAAGASGAAWVFGSSQTLGAPLLPVSPVESLGNAYAVRIAANGSVDRASRFGGLPTANGGYATLPAFEGGVGVLANGTVALAGSVMPTLSSSLLPTQHYDLPFVAAPGVTLPSSVRDALPPASCSGSACSGSAGLLAILAPDTSAATLSLSFDDLPNLTVRNPGTATAANLQTTATGYVVSSNCGTSLTPGSECSLALSGGGPGNITITSSNAPPFTATLPATTRTANSIAVVPHELDFGLQTADSAASARTLTVSNLGQSTQTFASKNASSLQTAYGVTETATTCTPAGDAVSKVLGPGGTCTITLGLSAGTDATNDGAINAHWQIGASDILMTGYAQAAAESLSAQTIDFGRQFVGGLRASRHLYLSNSSDSAKSHATVSSTNVVFTVVDECPATLRPRSVCRIVLGYSTANGPSSDAMSLYVDGMNATVLGETLPQPSITGSSSNPNLSVSPTAITFATAIPATTVSSESHTVIVGNTGAVPFALKLSIAGDYAYQTNCPATLAANSSCNVVVTFTPSGPGTRDGLLSVAAGSSGPVYVALSGTGTSLLPASGSSLFFGDVPLNTPSVQWLKVSQSFVSLQAASSDGSFKVLLVEDTGYGHGNPPAGAFIGTATGSCLSCYLGVQFLTTGTGAHTGTVTLSSSSSGKPLTLGVSGNGTPLTGLILTPISFDLGTVPVRSTTASTIFELTNGTANSVTATGLAATGDFAVANDATGGVGCSSGTLAPGASCFVPVRFAPAATGTRTGTLAVSTSAGQATSSLSGIGSDDPGVSFTPGELRFDNVPDAASTQQTITITNTSGVSATVSTPTVSDAHFTISNGCGTLATGASCVLTVRYTASNALAAATLSIPVTTAPAGAPGTTTYAIALTGLYTTESAGLQIIPGEHATVNFGASVTGTPALSRVLHVNNLTAKTLNLAISSPREFATTSATCGTLAPNGSCDLTVEYTPLSSGDTTGTVFLTGTPTDGSAAQTGIGYLEGYGKAVTSSASLAVTGNISPAGVVSFGQVPSGQTSTQTLTVTNPAGSPAGTVLTVRRVLSGFPYPATTTCGAPLTPGQSCAITVTYSPIFQAATGSGQTSTQTDADVLTIVSDGGNAPQYIDLNGSTTPVFVTTPNNTVPLAAFTTSQGSLYFGSVALGSASATQPVTLTNTGTATVHVTGVLASNGYSVSNGCATLVSGATCTLQVNFMPQVLGAALGSIEIQSDASSPLELISLLGNGTPAPVGTASATLSPQSLDFGRVQVNHSASQFATLTNTGTLPVTVTSISIAGDAGFALAASAAGTNACPPASGTLPAGSSCTVAVVFTPAITGTLRGTLSVVTSASSVPLTVALSGVGTQPQLVASPTSLSFGNVAVGSTGALSLTLANIGNQAVDGLSFTATAGFSVSSTCGITTLNAGSSCAVSVTFAPSAAGVVTGSLTIGSTDPASPLTIPLSGVGIVATGVSLSTLTATPAALNFGNVPVRSSTTLALVLSNPTAVPAGGLLFTPSAGFSVSSGCGTTLNAYSTCPIVVTFAPAAAGALTGTLTVQSSSTTTPLTVALTGTGTAVQAQLMLTPASLAFGTVSLGSSSSLSMTLTNSSATTVNSIALSTTSGFTVSTNCNGNLGPSSSCPIVVSFTPTFTGVTTGTLTVSSSDAASPLVAALSGSGVANGSFLLTVDGSNASSVTVQSGAPATYALLVTPTGGYTGTVALTCTPDTPVAYTACSLVPPTVTLTGGPQSSTATINTVSAVAHAGLAPAALHRTALWCLSPALLVLLLRRKRPPALLVLLFASMMVSGGCGSGGDARIRYVAPGTYTFHVTATSTGSSPVSQTVMLTVVVTPKP